MRAYEFADQGAAGIVLYAEDTGRYGLQQRSETVGDPGVWAAWGGGRDPGESLEQCACRELAEEGGYTGPIQLQRLGENLQYVTFLGSVPHEFEPRTNPEWQDYCWVNAGDWPGPLHPGTAAALANLPIQQNLDEKINQDIATQGWRAEKTITVPDVGKLHLQARNTSHITPPQFIVDVATPDGTNIGYFRFLVIDWEQPKTGWFATKSKKDPYVIGGNVSVWDQYQKKGIARQVYQWIKSLGNDVRPSTTQTAAGKAMWRGFARDPLNEESKTVEYNGIILRVSKSPSKLKVEALDDWANKVLGHVEFNVGDDRELDPQDLRVDDRYQSQGIARVMYDYVKSLGYTINRSYDQTDAGRGFWDKHRGEDVRVWEQDVAEGFWDSVKAGWHGDVDFGLDDRKVYKVYINGKDISSTMLSKAEAIEVVKELASEEVNSNTEYHIVNTRTKKIEGHYTAKQFYKESIEQGMTENFADGKNPGRKGLAKRSGVNTKASVSDLRKTAKNSSGEKQRMAHWLANMKSGRAKAKRK